jgi:hypothetical protein
MKVRTLVVVWTVVAGFADCLDAQTTYQLSVQPNRRVNSVDTEANYVEPAIADNPATPGNMIIASNNPYKGVTPRSKTPAWISTDNGQSWSANFMPNVVTNGTEETGGNDPSVVFSRNGWGVATRLTEGTSGTRIGGALSLSGTSWAGAFAVTPGDLMFLSVGPDYNNPSADAFYLSWGASGILKLWKSTDGLNFYSVPDGQVNADIENGGGFAHTAIGPNGEIYYIWEEKDDTGTTIWFQASYDGGATWMDHDLPVIRTDINIDTLARYTVDAAPERGVGFSAQIAVRRNLGAHGQVYIVFMDQADRDGDPDINNEPDRQNTDIFFRAAADNDGDGKPDGWRAQLVRVNDDQTTNSQFLPAMDVDQSTGRIAISWYDARGDSANERVEYYAALSTNGGTTFEANVKVSSGMSYAQHDQAQAALASDFDFGEYSAIVADKNTSSFHCAWADNSDSVGSNGVATFEIYTARLDVVAQP